MLLARLPEQRQTILDALLPHCTPAQAERLRAEPTTGAGQAPA